MTIDEAIKHAEWAAENSEGECSNEHRQLAEWLRNVRRANKVERRYTEMNRLLEDENAKLRKYAESYAKAVECEGCGWCPYDMDLVCGTETTPMRDGCRLWEEMRELGIEVDNE